MNEKRSNDYKSNKQINLDFYQDDKINDNFNNLKTLQKNPSKNSKPFFINNQNHIESINIINNNINYKNIILHNMLSPSKKYTISGKSSSRNKKNIKIEKNLLYDYTNNNKKMQIFGPKKQKSLNKNITFKFMLNPQEQENNYNANNINNLNLNDKEMKYKLKIYEKNNIINKLKDELEYYKNYYHNMNNNNQTNNLNIIIPDDNTNTINTTHNISKKNKIFETENMRNKIKNIFRVQKNDNGNLRNNNENNHNTLSNVFYRSNSNTIKRKLKLGLHPSELNLEINNDNNINNNYNNNYKYNSIEAERNNTNFNLKKNIKNKKHSIYSLNINILPNENKDNKNVEFNYVENFEKLKKRMNNLVNNLFDLINKQYQK